MAGSRRLAALAALTSISLVLSACAGGAPGEGSDRVRPTAAGDLTPADVAPPGAFGSGGPAADGGAVGLLPAPDAEGRAWVDDILARSTLRQEIAQLIFPWTPGAYAAPSSPEFQDILDDVEMGVGGLLVSIGLPHSYAAKLNELQRRAEVPLLVTSDFESGGPGMRLGHIFAVPSLLDQGGGTSFPPTMALGAVRDVDGGSAATRTGEAMAEEVGRITAVEARAVGVQFDLAPVLDVNSNPENPVINTRSFGEDPEAVARLGTAFIRGLHRGGALATAKHFPGHGDTGSDSHIALPAVRADRARLDTVELVPFQRAIDQGVDGVMTAHVTVPGVLGDQSPPATFSSYFLTDLLRTEMGFDGLVITDALRMGAITANWGGGEAGVLALEAGSDILVDPEDPRVTLEAVVAAVESGRLTRERIRESVRRILELKARVGLHRAPLVDLEAVDERVATGEHLAFADTVAARSITLVRDREGLVPVLSDSVASVLSVTWTRPGDPLGSRTADGLLAERYDGFQGVQLSEADGEAALDALWNRAWEADRVLVHSFVAYQAATGTIGVPGSFGRFVRRLAVHRPVVASSFGNPYVLSAFPEVGSYLVAWGSRDVSQRAAVSALAGEAPITGALPIGIPPLHRRGDGLIRQRVVEPLERRRRDELTETGLVARRAAEGGDQVAPAGPPVSASRAETPATGAGMSEEGLARLDTLLLDAVEARVTPGAVLAVTRGDRIVRLRGYGWTDWAPDAPPATPTTLYDIASLTKVAATTPAVMRLVDRGSLSLDDRVVDHLPWWSAGDPRKEEVTIRHLLLHRSGLPAFRPWFGELRGRAAYERAVAAEPLTFAPGAQTEYSDLGMITLGWIVEEVSGQPLDVFAEAELWGPLGMVDTGFDPDPSLRPRIAPTEVDRALRGIHVHGVVHDENAWAMGGVAGHAGVFSTASDLALYTRSLLTLGLREGCADALTTDALLPTVGCLAPWTEGGRVFSEETVAAFTRRWDDSSSRALGWDTPSGRSSAGDYFGSASFGHTGFTGTSIWIDPELDLAVVLLTNRVNPTRDNSGHVELRREVHDAVAGAVTDVPVEPRR